MRASASDADLPLKRCDDDPIVDASRPGHAKRRHLGHLLEMIARQAAGKNDPVRRHLAVDGRQRRIPERRESLNHAFPEFVHSAIKGGGRTGESTLALMRSRNYFPPS